MTRLFSVVRLRAKHTPHLQHTHTDTCVFNAIDSAQQTGCRRRRRRAVDAVLLCVHT